MNSNVLSELEGSGSLRNEQMGVTIKGSWHMRYSLDLQSAPEFTFYPFSSERWELVRFLEERVGTMSEFSISEATTCDGQPVKVEEIHHVHGNVSFNGDSFVQFRARDVTIGKKDLVNEIRFHIPNLRFKGTEWSTLEDKKQIMDKSTRQLGNYFVEIRQILNYRDVISELEKIENGVAITAIVTVRSKASTPDAERIMELMETLNELLNLAMGRLVLWPKCEGYREDRLTWQELRATDLHAFGPAWGFVDVDRPPWAFWEFVSSSFDNFSRWFSKYELTAKRILRSYLWGLNLPSRETQIYSLSYALEQLVDIFLNKKDKSYFAGKVKSDLRGRLQEFVKTEVLPKITNREKTDEFKGNKLDGRIETFLRRPFKDRIKTLLKKTYKNSNYKNEWDTWVDDFVNARNDVIHSKGKKDLHEKYFRELFSAWCKGLELIELIFLGNNWCSTNHRRSKIACFKEFL